MEKVLSVIAVIMPILGAMYLGMLCRKKKFLTREGVDALKKVIINLTLPFALFASFATAEYTLNSLIVPVIMYVICTVMLGLGFLVIRISRTKSKLSPFLASGFEAGMLGIPLFGLLFPGQASKFAILILGQEIFVFTLYKMLLTGKTSPKAIVKDFLTSPTLIAVILGLIVGATGLFDKLGDWGVAGIVTSVTDFLSAPTAMIILLTVGYDLVLKEIPWKKTIGMIGMRLGIAGAMLALVILLNRTVMNGMIFEGAAVLLFMLPPPYVIPVFADEPSERVQISSALSALTLVTMVLFAVFSVVLGMQ